MPVWVDECQVDRVTGVLAPYPRAIVCVRIPIEDPAFVKRFLELKKESAFKFEKHDRTVELLVPSKSQTAFQLLRMCLSPMVDFLGRGMDASANTLPFLMQLDAKIMDTVAILFGHGKKWPTGV